MIVCQNQNQYQKQYQNIPFAKSQYDIIVYMLYVIVLSVNALIIKCHPITSGVLCHGPVLAIHYRYHYQTNMIMNNNDYREPTGFGLESEITVTNVWQNSDHFLLSIVIDWCQFKSRSASAKFNDGPKISDWNQPLYAQIDTNGVVVAVFSHKNDVITSTNLKKSILHHLSTKNQLNSTILWSQTGNRITKNWSNTNSNVRSLLSPDVSDEWHVFAQLADDRENVITANGWQNVTLKSRIYSHAHSKLHINFSIKLLSEQNSANKMIDSKSITEAIKSLGDNFIISPSQLSPEGQICHNCKSLANLVKERLESIKEESTATIPMTISYLKLIERVRSSGPGSTKDDMLKLLKTYKKKKDILSFLLDLFSGSRTEQSINAGLEFLNLPKSEDIDSGERFLVSLAASSVTGSQTGGTHLQTMSNRDIADTLLRQLLTPKWKSDKLKYTSWLILATLIKAHITEKQESDDLVDKVIKHLRNELESCGDTDCRVVLLHAIGNAGVLSPDVYQSIKKYILKGKRESIAAAKALKECMDAIDVSQIADSIRSHLLHLLLRVVYDHQQETTSRLIAAELISKYIGDEKTVRELIKHLPSFDNNELATIIWTRAFQDGSNSNDAKNNWLLHSTTLNGSSAAFRRVLGGTNTMNASYQMVMELLNKGKLLKESSFDVLLTTLNGDSQHILSVAMFARGLQSIAGDSDSSSSSTDEESTMAGMSLRIMNFQLRPFVFFTGTGELMGHVWSGTASDPTNAFQGNILLTDYYSSYPLINGFVVEQQLRGLLSLDLSGEIQISLWNRNSHSIVHTSGAFLFQGSQTILTSERTTSATKQFSFGTESKLDFVTDLDFYSTPFKMCMQIVQPAFILRHNTRKYEQVNSEDLHRRIHRRFYSIPAKSYALHRDNNEMCALMNAD